MIKKEKLGKVVAQVKGLRIRVMSKSPTAEWGIYAGKHFYRAFFTLEGAIKTATRITEKKPTYYSLWQDYENWKRRRKG